MADSPGASSRIGTNCLADVDVWSSSLVVLDIWGGEQALATSACAGVLIIAHCHHGGLVRKHGYVCMYVCMYVSMYVCIDSSARRPNHHGE